MSKLFLRDPDIVARAKKVDPVRLATCCIVQGELVFMAEHSRQRVENRQRIDRFLLSFLIHEIDTATADWYGTLKALLMTRFGPKDHAKRRHTTLAQLGVSENDLWIAACAKRYDLIVVSTDTDFRRIQDVTELHVESWL